MSVSDKEISSFSGVGDDHDDDDDDDGGVHRKKQRATGGSGFGGFAFSTSLGKKAKRFVWSPLKKKLSRQKQSQAKAKAKASSSCCSGNIVNRTGGCFCFTRSLTGQSVSPNGSQTSDPNDPNFTYEMLRILIERSDFCCKECNTHLDSEDV